MFRASLFLDFSISKKLDPRITFTRSSGGSYVGADGLIKYAGVNEARFDHNPVTGESLGLLIEESRYNDWIYSGQNVITGWSFTPTTLSFDNTQTAPDGNTNVIKFTERPVTTSGMGFNQTLSVTSGTSYTFSVFVKQPTGSSLRYCSILLYSTGFGEFKIASFNPTNGSVLYTSGTLITSVQQYSNGWWRFAVTGTATATTTSQFSVRFTNNVLSSTENNGGPYGNYTGDGSSYLYFFGPQVENGAFMTSYIPTSASTVTRSADVARITGANFSSWYRQNEGTVFADASSYMGSAAVTRGVVSIDGTGGDVHRIFRQSDLQPVVQALVGGVVQLTFGFGATWSTAASRRISYAYAVNNFGASIDGGTAQTDVSGTLPTTSTLNIGSLSGGNHFGGHLRRLTYWPKRLPNSQLRALTR